MDLAALKTLSGRARSIGYLEEHNHQTGKRTFHLFDMNEPGPDFEGAAIERKRNEVQAQIDKLTAQADRASGLHQLKSLYVEIAELEEQLEQLALLGE